MRGKERFSRTLISVLIVFFLLISAGLSSATQDGTIVNENIIDESKSIIVETSDLGNSALADEYHNWLAVLESKKFQHNSIITGSYCRGFNCTAEIDDYQLNSIGGRDSFIAWLNEENDITNLINISSIGSDIITTIDEDQFGNIFVGGTYCEYYYSGYDEIFDNCSMEVQGHLLSSTGISMKHGFVMKINQNKDVEWVVNFTNSTDVNIGDVLATNDGGVIVGLDFESKIDINNQTIMTVDEAQEAWLVKVNSQGNMSWQRSFHSTLSSSISGLVTDGENLIVVGAFKDQIMLRLDTSNSECSQNQIQLYSSTNFILNSHGMRDVFILGLSLDGGCVNFLESYGNDGDDYPTDIVYSSDESYLLSTVITPENENPKGYSHGAVMKIDNSGKILWLSQVGSENTADIANSVDILPNGNLVVGGLACRGPTSGCTFAGYVAINGVQTNTSEGIYSIEESRHYEGYVSILDDQGNILSLTLLSDGVSHVTSVEKIDALSDGNILVSGFSCASKKLPNTGDNGCRMNTTAAGKKLAFEGNGFSIIMNESDFVPWNESQQEDEQTQSEDEHNSGSGGTILIIFGTIVFGAIPLLLILKVFMTEKFGKIGVFVAGSITTGRKTETGDSSRKILMDYLASHGETFVTKIANDVGFTRSTVRHHLDILEKEELVKCRKVGRYQMYSITSHHDFKSTSINLADSPS